MPSQGWLLVLLALFAGGLVLAAGRILMGLRRKPADLERQRRTRLASLGRPVDGQVTDLEGDLIHYTYSVHGAVYTASQDISTMGDRVPRDSSRVVGPATVRYWVRNPANSIIICETWSGVRVRDPQPGSPSQNLNTGDQTLNEETA
ncbi:MAG: hypothetical protein FJW39_14530 [Acidobacteria bacterium]|nr:hypothetical protein [Acidobacteriota bacterium]